MNSFSVRQRSHRLLIGEYSLALRRIPHDISCSVPARFSCQTCLDSWVLFCFPSCLSVDLWLLYLSLNDVDADPMYTFSFPAPSGFTLAS